MNQQQQNHTLEQTAAEASWAFIYLLAKSLPLFLLLLKHKKLHSLHGGFLTYAMCIPSQENNQICIP